MFFQTNLVKFWKNLSSFPKTYRIIYNSIVRKFVRLGGFANKNRLNRFKNLQLICNWLEELTGIASPDTGKEIIRFHYNGYNSIVFTSPYEQSFGAEDVRELKLLAKILSLYL